MVIRRIGVLSLAKLMGAMYALLGLIIGVFFALLALVGAGMGAAMEEEAATAMFGAFFGVGAVIFLPIFYGVLGFLGGALMAFLFNLVSGLAGGLELDVDATRPTAM